LPRFAAQQAPAAKPDAGLCSAPAGEQQSPRRRQSVLLLRKLSALIRQNETPASTKEQPRWQRVRRSRGLLLSHSERVLSDARFATEGVTRPATMTLLVVVRSGHDVAVTGLGVKHPRSGRHSTTSRRPAFVIARTSRRRHHPSCSARTAGEPAPSDRLGADAAGTRCASGDAQESSRRTRLSCFSLAA
jgi:hypothetical protein